MDLASQSLPTEEMLVKALVEAKSRTSLERLGMRDSRYGLD
jgi:hypothetical protein